MHVKVCGLRDEINIKEVAELMPSYMGFIFYQASKRYIGQLLNKDIISSLPRSIKRVGVFVDESPDIVIETFYRTGLDYIQLHGDEDHKYLKSLSDSGIRIIKAFRVGKTIDFKEIGSFSSFCDFFLFDTSAGQKGGTGIRFNWSLLEKYPLTTPFFISGGIGPEDLDDIRALQFEYLHAIDVNSRFELEPGLKEVQKLKQFISETDNI